MLRGIGGLADELAAFSNRCFGEISRVLAHLELAYHQVSTLASDVLDSADPQSA